jgi:hypothetical protein
VAKDWDTAVDSDAGAEARTEIFTRINELLNRRSSVAIWRRM